MEREEPDNTEPVAGAIKREIHHIAIDGEGSVTIVEFKCDGECHRLLVTVKGSSVSARWLEPDESSEIPPRIQL